MRTAGTESPEIVGTEQTAETTAAKDSPKRPVRRHRTRGAARMCGLFARRNGQRQAMESLLNRARFLHMLPRTIVCGFYQSKLTVPELAILHGRSIHQMRRDLLHWVDTLNDPHFLLAARSRQALPADLAQLADEYWLAGLSLRNLARKRHMTLHAVRRQLDRARALLVAVVAKEGAEPHDVRSLLG